MEGFLHEFTIRKFEVDMRIQRDLNVPPIVHYQARVILVNLVKVAGAQLIASVRLVEAFSLFQ